MLDVRCPPGRAVRPLLLSLILTAVAGLSAAPGTVDAQPVVHAASQEAPVYVEPALLAKLQARSRSSMLVYLTEKPDLTPAYSMDWQARGRFVHAQLKDAAERSQKTLIDYLDAEGIKHQSFWIDNVVHIPDADLSTLNVLTDRSRFSGIRSILGEQEVALVEPESVEEDSVLTRATLSAISNIERINAPEVWDLGFTGKGIVVGGIDTGVRHTHRALVSQYRGTVAPGQYSHAYNWWDPYDNSAVPKDTNNHGSHITGTMTGDDGEGSRIGVAPGAKWIHCMGFNPGGFDAKILECGQFMAAPWDLNGQNADPDMRPHVINNSWSDCGRTTNLWYEGVIDAWIAAGIVPVYANGNAGNCNYSRPPGLNTVGNPARYGKVLAVGSTGTDNGLYASHSNWGPTLSLAPGLPNYPDHRGFPNIKPNVVAPGVSVRSAGRDNDQMYYMSNGTSMSAPHVAGLVALMWEAAPCLIGDFASTGTLIMETAEAVPYDSGGSPAVGPGNVPNYATGWGEVNAEAAVRAAIAKCGGFTITAEPSLVRACAATDAVFDIGLLAHGDFTDPVTLAVESGLPASLSANFAPNPLAPAIPAASSVLTIEVPAGHASGLFPLTLRAASSGPASPAGSKTRAIALRVDASVLPIATLSAPADGASNVEMRPEFSWAGVAQERYRIQVATDTGFTTPLFDDVVTGTAIRFTAPLATGTTYYWRVQGENACGAGNWSATYSLSTRIQPVASVTPAALNYLFTSEATQTRDLTIANLGTAALDWTLSETTLSSLVTQPAADDGVWSFIGPSGGTISSVAVSPMDPDVMLAGTTGSGINNGRVYRTEDGGDNWVEVISGATIYRIRFATDGTAFVAASNGVHRSTNNGLSWTRLTLGIGTAQSIYSVAAAASNPAIVYAGVGDNSGTQPINLIRSTNGGNTWQNVTPPLGSAMTGRVITIDPNNPDVVIAGFDLSTGGRRIWVSTDGAATWTERSAGLPANPPRDLHFDGTRLLLGGGQAFNAQYLGLYESLDLGVTWTAIQIANPPPLVQSITVDPQNTNRIFLGAALTGVYLSEDGGATWQAGIGGTGTYSVNSVTLIPGYADKLMLGVEAAGVMRSDDGGDTFVSKDFGINETALYSLHVNPINPQEMAGTFKGSNNGAIFTTNDGGATWVRELAPPVRYEAVRYSYEGVLYALSNGPTNSYRDAVWRREADGSWVHLGPSQGSPTSFLTDLKTIRFSRDNPDLILVGGKDGVAEGNEATVWRSLDRGATWQKTFEDGSNRSVQAMEIIRDGTDQNILAAWGALSFGGVIRSSDGGATWSDSSTGIPSATPYANSAYHFCSHPQTPERVFFLTGNSAMSQLFRSDDAGVTWTATGWSTPATVLSMACDPLDDSVLYIGVSKANTATVWRSQDTGASFQSFNQGLAVNMQPRSLAFRGDSSMVVGTARGAYEASLGGAARACQTPQDINWLSLSDTAGTTAPGQSEGVIVTANSAGLSTGQYRAQLCFNSNDENNPLIRVPVTLTMANAEIGTLQGQVTTVGQCGIGSQSAAGAQVIVTGQHNTFTLTTSASGRYEAEIDVSESPLSIAVQRAGHLDGGVSGITLVSAGTVTSNVALQLDAPCVEVAPDSLAVNVQAGQSTTTTLRLDNTRGAGALTWNVASSLPSGEEVTGSTFAPVSQQPLNPASLVNQALPSVQSLGRIAGNFNCTGGAGLIINDDNSAESGMGASPDLVQRLTFVDYFVPENYPVSIDALCITLLSQGPTSLDFELVVYADDGVDGAPGTQLGVLPATATALTVIPPVPASLPWHSFDLSSLNLRLTSGGIYLGLRWTPSLPNVVVAADTSPNRPANIGGGYRMHNDGPWNSIVSSTEGYRALFLRALTTDASGCDAPTSVDWLTVLPANGTVTGGQFTDLDVAVDATNLSAGSHFASLCLSSNDPARGLIVVPVQVDVSPDPADPAQISIVGGNNQAASVGTNFSQPLAVQVRNGLNQPLVGVNVAFNAPASGASAVLSSTTAVTDVNGVASVTAVANTQAGNYAVQAVVEGAGNVGFTLTNQAPAVDVAIEISSTRSSTRPGQLVDYFVTVRNNGPDLAEGVDVAADLSSQLDVASATWQCMGPVNSGCTSAGVGDLVDSGLRLGNGASVNYLLSAPVQWTATGEAVLAGVVSHPLDSDAGNNSDEARVRILFDEIFADGFESGTGLFAQLSAALEIGGTQYFVAGNARPGTLETLLLATTGQAEGRQRTAFSVQSVSGASQSWIRIVVLDETGTEYASPWMRLALDRQWSLTLLDAQAAGQRSLRLSSGAEQTQLPLFAPQADYTLWVGAASTPADTSQ